MPGRRTSSNPGRLTVLALALVLAGSFESRATDPAEAAYSGRNGRIFFN